jgi:uncharacterized tellurite resistance protein B-like protein
MKALDFARILHENKAMKKPKHEYISLRIYKQTYDMLNDLADDDRMSLIAKLHTLVLRAHKRRRPNKEKGQGDTNDAG